jgi:prophage DNA circulation protein
MTSRPRTPAARATVDLLRGAASWRASSRSASWSRAVLAAAAAVQNALFAAWQAVASVALHDLTLRALQLPRPASYLRQSPPPALSRAYRLYQDVGRATQLVALNDGPHPLFMPLAGKVLTA